MAKRQAISAVRRDSRGRPWDVRAAQAMASLHVTTENLLDVVSLRCFLMMFP